MHIWLSLLCTPASLADHRFIRNSATLEQTQSYIRSSVLEGWSVPAPIGLYMQPISPYATMGSLLLTCVVFSVKLLVNPFILLKKKKKNSCIKMQRKTSSFRRKKPMKQNLVFEALGIPSGSLQRISASYFTRKHCLRNIFSPKVLKCKNLGLRIKFAFHSQCCRVKAIHPDCGKMLTRGANFVCKF